MSDPVLEDYYLLRERVSSLETENRVLRRGDAETRRLILWAVVIAAAVAALVHVLGYAAIC